MNNAKILLAEDSPELALIMQTYLGYRGYVVELASNGKKILEHPNLSCVDLIIMDIEMPVMDGIETTKRLRAKGITTPILACSGLYDSFDSPTLLELGFSAHIVKPVDFEKLFRMLKDLTIHKDPSLKQ